MQEEHEGEFRTGIPNERILPQLHVLCHRRNYSLDHNKVIKRSEVNDQVVKNE